jgi:trehalose-phosphatase
MPTVHAAADRSAALERFFAALARAPRRLLLLDYDGTLAPFHVDPARARPYPGVSERLDAIMKDRRTRLVLITGRWTRDLLPLLALKRRPEIWGSHGWEQLKPNGVYAVAPIGEAALAKLLDADALEVRIHALGGRCERKPGGFAVHWRGLAPNQIANIRGEVFENWMDQGLHRDLVWHDFDGGIELRAPGRDKGYVVQALLAESPGAVTAYLGDDTTDEDAFRAIKDKGLGVLVRPEFRPTEADLWLRPPAGLLDFLERWREAGR